MVIMIFHTRYEAASTIYGPHTLGAYIQQYTYLTQVHLTPDIMMLNVK